MTVCMGYTATTPTRENRKTPPEGGRKAMRGERRTQYQLVKMARYHLTVTHRFWLVVILTINQTIATLYCAKVTVTILICSL